MKATTVRVLGFFSVVALALLAGAALLPTRASNEASGPREVRLVAKNMTFYLEGDETPNPTIRLKAGEEVKITLRNADQGMNHDFTVTSWKLATKLLEGEGQDAVSFRVPDAKGSQQYTCTPHAVMMRGTIEIE